MRKILIILLGLLLLSACTGKSEKNVSNVSSDTLKTTEAALSVEDNKQDVKSDIDKASQTGNIKKSPESKKSASSQTVSDKPKEAATEEKSSYKVTFMEIGSKTCIPCKMMQPIMKEIETEYEGIVKVEFYDLNEDRQIGSQYNIRVMPTQVFLDANGREFFRHEGFYPKVELAKMLDDYLAKLPK